MRGGRGCFFVFFWDFEAARTVTIPFNEYPQNTPLSDL